jgi:hypothetical protein
MKEVVAYIYLSLIKSTKILANSAKSNTYIAFLGLVRYKNPTPNPLPASEDGAMIYLI